jgi:hypothetical protein
MNIIPPEYYGDKTTGTSQGKSIKKKKNIKKIFTNEPLINRK